MKKIHVDMIVGHGYAADTRLTAEIPDGYWIGAYHMGHTRIILAYPQERVNGPGQALIPLPTFLPQVYDDGRTVMSPLNPLEWTDKRTCPADGDVVWRMDARANDPVLCTAYPSQYGWEFTFTQLKITDLQPEITAREKEAGTILNAIGWATEG